MKDYYSFSNILSIAIILFICNATTAQDFKVQHIQDGVARTGGTNTGFTAVASLNNAVALANNNRKVSGGRHDDVDTPACQGDDISGARQLTGTGTLSYYREGGSVNTNTRFNTSIWEYIGTGGGANEFIVRGRYAIALNGTTNSTTQALTGVSNAEKVVPFITGIINDNGGGTQDADSGTAIAYLSDASTLNILKGSNGNNVTVYITVVEFTGSNWTVLHGDSGSTGADTGTITLNDDEDGTSGTATDVSDWSEAIIFTHHIGDTDTNGVNDARVDNWPIFAPGSDDQSVDWTFYAGHDSGGTNRHFTHVLVNPEINVTRYQDTSKADGESTIDITSAGLSDLSEAMVVGSSIVSGTTAYYAIGWRNYYLNSLTEVAHWCHRPGLGTDSMSHEIQIVDFANVPVQSEGPGGVTTSLDLWLKADTGVEELAADPAEDTDPVLNWLDNTINNNDATQSTGVNQPTYNEAVINFNPSINFDGTNHEMTASIPASGEVTIFAITDGNISTKSLLHLDNGVNGSLDIEQTAAATVRGSYTNSTPTTAGIATNDLTTISSGTPYLVNYRHQTTSTNRLFINGITQTLPAASGNTLSGTFTAGIGADPSSSSTRWDGEIAELIVYNYRVPQAERWQIESYLGIKYGITIGVNGTSQDYVDSDARVIWDQSANVGYNYNVTGIGKDDASELEQKQSKSINTTDDITVGIKDIATTNTGNTTEFFEDKTFLMWGHDNGGTSSATDITKDFSSGTSESNSVSATPITQIWKFVTTDSVPTVKISIPESMVSGTNAGGEDYVMIISDDDTFTTNVTSATMEDVGTELEVDFYIEGTKYITFGSTAEVTIVGGGAATFDRTDKYISAGDVNDLAGIDYTISAWVKRNAGTGKFDVVSKRNYTGENTDLDPGPDAQGTYSHGYAFRINQTNQFRMVWRDPEDGTNNIMETTETIPEDEWHHIAASYDYSENMAILYIDGIHVYDSDDYFADKGVAHDPMDTPSDSHFMIGAAEHRDRQQKLGGSVDEVRVWDVPLSGDQIRYIMNQEIEENGALNADGKILPSGTTKNEIVSIPWNNLIAYYPMNTMVFGSLKDESNNGNDASMINYDLLDEQTAPLPYKTKSGGTGEWDDPDTWENGDKQYLPGVVSYLYESEADVDKETMDYNIVQIDDDVTMDNSDSSLIPNYKNDTRTVLGLIVNTGADLQLDGDNATDTGNALTVSHYLKINGTLDLEGESQLIQTTDSDFDATSSGTLERDQQGSADLYTYNYWSAPVGLSNGTTNNNNYTLPDILNDGTNAASPDPITWLTSGFDGSNGDPISLADYWIWKYNNLPSDDYPSWQHVRSTGSLQPGEGFTMKGSTDTGGVITTEQNYVFNGKPYNGDITLTLSAGNDYLIGNPYASAIDADEFILDNVSDGAGRAASNIIDGTLYYWDHFANASHYLADYEGGYATYTLLGSTVAVSNDTRINNSGATGTKTPEQYIPVGQGFFVTADAGGTITFKNSQRTFVKEGGTSQFMRTTGKTKKGESSNNDTDQNVPTDTREKIKIMLESPGGYHRQLLVGVDENATDDYDTGYDGILIDAGKEDMYWIQGENKLVIQAVEDFNDNRALPLGLSIEQEGEITIKIDDLKNIPDNRIIYLHDKEFKMYHELTTRDYVTYIPAGEYLDRFEIVFGTLEEEIEVVEIENLVANFDIHYSNKINSIIIFNPDSEVINEVEMKNILGQTIIKNTNVPNDHYYEYKTGSLHTGTYLISIKTNEETIIKKVVVQ